MQGFIKGQEKSSWCPKHLPRPLQAGGKRSSEIFFPSHRNFHRGKNILFPIQSLLELPQTAPREGWGRSGTLQRGEAGGTPPCLEQGPSPGTAGGHRGASAWISDLSAFPGCPGSLRTHGVCPRSRVSPVPMPAVTPAAMFPLPCPSSLFHSRNIVH